MSSHGADAPARLLEGPQPPAAGPDEDRRWIHLRLALVVGWLVLTAGVVGLGERPGSWDEVARLVEAGEVDRVTVVGELPAGTTGYSVVEVGWRHGLLARHAQVVQVRRPGNKAEAASVAEDDVPLLRTSPSERLRTLQRDVQVVSEPRTSQGELLGWRIPAWLGAVAFGLFLGWLGYLVTGPAPWRATRWAWFWLAFPPVGVLAHLLLSGPTPGLPGPRRPQRRLTGGWAFLVYLVVSAVLVERM